MLLGKSRPQPQPLLDKLVDGTRTVPRFLYAFESATTDAAASIPAQSDSPLVYNDVADSKDSQSSVVSPSKGTLAATEFMVTDLINDDSGIESPLVRLVFYAEKPPSKASAHHSTSHAISLELFRVEKALDVERKFLTQSPFFSDRLADKWRQAKSIKIRLPRPATVHAMVHAIEYLVSGKVSFDYRALFELMYTAHFLNVPQLRNNCAARIAASLSDDTVVMAAHFACKCDLEWLVDRCYTWIVRNLIETGEYAVLLDGTHTPSSLDDMKRVILRHGPYSVPLRVFLPVFQKRYHDSLKFLR